MTNKLPLQGTPAATKLSAATIFNYTYTVTGTDVSNLYIDITLAHNLGYIPIVDGSFYNTNDSMRRQMPFSYYSSASYYGSPGKATSAYVGIDRVDSSNIYVKVMTIDINGLSWIASNMIFNFRMICKNVQSL